MHMIVGRCVVVGAVDVRHSAANLAIAALDRRDWTRFTPMATVRPSKLKGQNNFTKTPAFTIMYASCPKSVCTSRSFSPVFTIILDLVKDHSCCNVVVNNCHHERNVKYRFKGSYVNGYPLFVSDDKGTNLLDSHISSYWYWFPNNNSMSESRHAKKC